jgi:hypothetical protein
LILVLLIKILFFEKKTWGNFGRMTKKKEEGLITTK